MTKSRDALPRRERRRIELEDRRAERPERRVRQRQGGQGSGWRSPMVLFTAAALVVGVVIIGFAFLRPGAAPVDELTSPRFHVPAGLSAGRTLGDAEAPVTVEIWSDFQCPACERLATGVEPTIITTFVTDGTAKLVYRDAAFQGQRGNGPYDESVEAAAGARCAADQGRFWEMHDWIFANWDGENEGAFRAERLRAIAGSAGLDLATFDACMAVGDKQTAVRGETQQGVAAGVNATPTLFVNGVAVTGVPTAAQLSELIRQAAAQGAMTVVAANVP